MEEERVTPEEIQEKKGIYRKQLFDAAYMGLIGLMIFGYTIHNVIEMRKERYFYNTYQVPRVLGWFFDRFGPIPTTILMFLFGSLFLGYFIYRLVGYLKQMKQLKLSQEEENK